MPKKLLTGNRRAYNNNTIIIWLSVIYGLRLIADRRYTEGHKFINVQTKHKNRLSVTLLIH